MLNHQSLWLAVSVNKQLDAFGEEHCALVVEGGKRIKRRFNEAAGEFLRADSL